MKLFERLIRRSSTPAAPATPEPADPLPRLALPPIHEPVASLDVFDTDAPLDPIPLGLGEQRAVYWRPEQDGSALLVLGGTGDGGTVFTHAVIEQCRTRGWQLLIATGRGTEFGGFEGAANVSNLARWRGNWEDEAAGECLATVVIAHRILAERLTTSVQRAARDPEGHDGFTPVLLVLDELGALMDTWEREMLPEDFRQLLTMIENLLRVGRELRCHVLINPASGWRWKPPASWVSACTTVLLGSSPHSHAMNAFADPDAVRAIAAQSSRPVKGRGIAAPRAGSDSDPVAFQTFYTYSACEVIDDPRLPPSIADNWRLFKEKVSDPTPALHPQLRLNPAAVGMPDIFACTESELFELPVITGPVEHGRNCG